MQSRIDWWFLHVFVEMELDSMPDSELSLPTKNKRSISQQPVRIDQLNKFPMRDIRTDKTERNLLVIEPKRTYI